MRMTVWLKLKERRGADKDTMLTDIPSYQMETEIGEEGGH